MALNKTTLVLAAALFLSLSVNFFLAGMMLGDAVAVPGTPPPVSAEKTREQRRAEWEKREAALHAALSAPDREVLRRSTDANRENFERMKAALDEARQNVAAAMSAEPFDEAALDSAIRAETEIKGRLLSEMYRARREVMEQLSPEGRATLKEMMPMRRWRGEAPSGASREIRPETRPMRLPPGSPRPENRPPPAPPALPESPPGP